MALVVVALVGSGCSHEQTALVRLDGSPRFPADEGVATTLTRHQVVLDGQRSYEVDPRFVSFSTYNGALQPMVDRLGQYVQLGAHGHTATWMAGVAAVIPGSPRTVYYLGRLRKVDDQRHAQFTDGTVLRLAPGVTAPAGAGRLRARIDADRHLVVELVPG